MLHLPFKLNQAGRHHIPRQKHKVTNWHEYDASLRQRGSLTVWFTAEAVEAWAAEPRTTRGGQPWYSALAILTALTLRAVFRLAYRQTEGLVGSVIGLLGRRRRRGQRAWPAFLTTSRVLRLSRENLRARSAPYRAERVQFGAHAKNTPFFMICMPAPDKGLIQL